MTQSYDKNTARQNYHFFARVSRKPFFLSPQLRKRNVLTKKYWNPYHVCMFVGNSWLKKESSLFRNPTFNSSWVFFWENPLSNWTLRDRQLTAAGWATTKVLFLSLRTQKPAKPFLGKKMETDRQTDRRVYGEKEGALVARALVYYVHVRARVPVFSYVSYQRRSSLALSLESLERRF